MKRLITLLLCLLFSVTIYAQLDNEKTSTKISAEDSKDKKGTSLLKTPVKITPNNKVNGLSVPETASIGTKNNEFSMFDRKKFANPGELYEDKLKRHLKSQSPTEEAIANNGSTTNQYFGDFKTKAVFVNVVYRDHQYPDGDYVRVFVNDDVVVPSMLLETSFKGLKLDLQPGFNKIDFQALNQGESGPNTAEFKVLDDNGNIIASNQWNLATGIKATVILVKEE